VQFLEKGFYLGAPSSFDRVFTSWYFFVNFWKNSTIGLNVGNDHCPLIEGPTLAFSLAKFPFEAMELHLNNNVLK